MYRKAFLLLTILSLPQGAVSETGPLTVMTFNILYGTANKTGHSWETRKESVAEVLTENQADLIGLQEVLHFQLEFLREKLGCTYGVVGEGREGGTRGEYSPVFYKNTRFIVTRSGRFWLSDHPDQIGSKDWVSLPRIVTWVDLVEKETDRHLFFANTHFAHDSSEARLKSARLICQRFADLVPERTPCILVGDFNCGPGSAPHEVFTDLREGRFTDTLSATGVPPKPTFGGFAWPPPEEGKVIDWILYRGPFHPLRYAVLDGKVEEVIPSDHYPVLAVFDWR